MSFLKQTERQVQRGIITALRTLGWMVFAVPNGGSRNAREGAAMKLDGVLAGAPDLVVFKNGRCVFLEVKTEGGRLSEVQKSFRAQCKIMQQPYYVVRSLADAMEVISGR